MSTILQKQNKYDVICIGDIVSDAFIKINPNSQVRLQQTEQSTELVFEFGAKIPIGETTLVHGVGNSANAAVACSRLGLNTSLISYVGDDKLSEKILLNLLDNLVSVEFVNIQEGKRSNMHYVLWYGNDRTILVNHEVYDYKFPNITKEEAPSWFYLSSISAAAGVIYDDLIALLKSNKDIKLCFQPGSFQLGLINTTLKELTSLTTLFVVNKEELRQITNRDVRDIKESIMDLLKLGVENVVITDGPQGAYLMSARQQRLFFLPAYPDLDSPKERTGAGDAFTSTVVGALGLGCELRTAVMWGAINSMNVVRFIGGQEGLLSRAAIENYIKIAPESFITREVS
jgi:sugar/nucleoside kinase (ribokinase family)